MMTKSYAARVLALALALIFAAAPPQALAESPCLAIKNVTVIDVVGAASREGQTVLVNDNRIARIGAVADVEIPIGARHVEGNGKFLVPGLWDMHMHLSLVSESALPVLVANGVTGVRDMGGGELSQIDGWREQIRSSRDHRASHFPRRTGRGWSTRGRRRKSAHGHK